MGEGTRSVAAALLSPYSKTTISLALPPPARPLSHAPQNPAPLHLLPPCPQRSSLSSSCSVTTIRMLASLPMGAVSVTPLLGVLLGRGRGRGRTRRREQQAPSKTPKRVPPLFPHWSVSMTPQLMVRLPVLVTLPPVHGASGRALLRFLLHPSRVRDALMELVRSLSGRDWLRRLATRCLPSEARHLLLQSSWKVLSQRSLLLWLRPQVTPQLVLRLPMLIVTLRAPPNLLAWAAATRESAASPDAERDPREGLLATFAFAPPLMSCRRMMAGRHPLVLQVVQRLLTWSTSPPYSWTVLR
jgi:hypothetical protein